MKSPTQASILLKKWFDTFEHVNSTYEAVEKLTGMDPESELGRTFFIAFDQYTWLLSEKIGDRNDWLSWFLWENDCGRKGLKVTLPRWKRPRAIKTLKDLEAVIVADKA